MLKDKIELRKLLQAQNQLVVADNYYVQHHCNTLSSFETAVLAWLISKIKPDDKPTTRYTVDCDELLAIMRWKDMRYASVKNAMHVLSKATWWLAGSATKNQGYIVYEEASYDPRLIRVWFLPSTHRFLFRLRERYATADKPLRAKAYTTSYPLAYHAVMPHRYSPRLYELLKSHINRKSWIFEFGTGSKQDIAQILGQWHTEDGTHFHLPPSWENWGTFRRDVLDPAQADIEKYTDITFTYKGLAHDMARHTTRAVRCIIFTVQTKSEEDQEVAVRAVNDKYHDYIDSWSAKHLSNKMHERHVSINTDIFSYKTPVFKPKPSTDNNKQEESVIPESDNSYDYDITEDADFAMLQDDDPMLPF